jgi:hypothetical protein
VWLYFHSETLWYTEAHILVSPRIISSQLVLIQQFLAPIIVGRLSVAEGGYPSAVVINNKTRMCARVGDEVPTETCDAVAAPSKLRAEANAMYPVVQVIWMAFARQELAADVVPAAVETLVRVWFEHGASHHDDGSL